MAVRMHTERGVAGPARSTKALWRLAFGVWCALSISLVSALGAAHFYALPTPGVHDEALVRAVAEVRAGRPQVLIHFLYAKCKCSQRIFEHLVERGALPEASERVVIVDGDVALRARLAARGYEVVQAGPLELESRYGVKAAPLLVVAGASDEPAYVGGYTARKQGLEVEDVRIAREVASGAQSALLPLFGCAVSEELQRMLDPLRLKYDAPSVKVDP